MTGVEILTSTEVVAKWAFNSHAFLIGCVITAVLTFILGLITHVYGNGLGDTIAVVVGSIILGLIFSAAYGSGEQVPAEYESHYMVTISDDVDFNEFNEKYEVVSQDGKLFTVRERQN